MMNPSASQNLQNKQSFFPLNPKKNKNEEDEQKCREKE